MEGMVKMERHKWTAFYKNKKVLVTGNTGFKGSWLTLMLQLLGAEVIGYSLGVPTEENLYMISGLEKNILMVNADIRDYYKLEKAFKENKPDIVIHLAAQPLVRESYRNPRENYEINVMGTVNVLECIRKSETVSSVLNVTTDKVYLNKEWDWGYREIEALDGFDPYSNSKSCSDIITHSYINSFFADKGIVVSTARAGNVIGGGDFAENRIIPDCVRAAIKKECIILRNPESIRPYQHVIEPLAAYLMIIEAQERNAKLADYYNVGPDETDSITTVELVEKFCGAWGEKLQQEVMWKSQKTKGPHEACYLKLDSSKIKNKITWRPKWSIDMAVEKTVEWYDAYLNTEKVIECMKKQIQEYLYMG